MIKSLILKKFRNLDLAVKLDPGINIVVGKNGLGKSNLVDCIYYLSFGKSFKRISEGDSIAWDDKLGFARIDAKLFDKENTKLAVTFSKVNGKNYKKLEVNELATIRRKFNNHVFSVLFTPETLDIIIGPPELRREELDDFIGGVNDEYEYKLRDYKNVVRNRNKVLALISDNRATQKELFYWSERMLELGSYILEERIKTLNTFLPILKENANKLFDSELGSLELNYSSKVVGLDSDTTVRELFAEKIKEGINKEISAKRTLYGPHRDDFELLLNGKNIRVFGSRGQQRLAALILKLSMWFYLQEHLELNPILLLDDIFSELDSKNSRKLEKLLEELGTQIIVTATEKYYLSDKFFKSGNKIKLIE